MNKPEVLAPAGDPEKLRFALAYGADAVYAGHPNFSLRARENGFRKAEDIAAAIETCRSLGKKFYLTSNIVPHNAKVKAFERDLHLFAEMKPHAMILSDPGMIATVKRNHPEVEIHLSVQANCTNWSTARFWYEQGVSRIILSRELSLREIAEIHREVPKVELEVFVHGSVCMATSGRCLLSNYMSQRDANQGRCSNACRFSYSLYTKNQPQSQNYIPLEGEFFLEEHAPGKKPIEFRKNTQELMPVDEDEYGTYIMNSKDLCAIDSLSELAEAGVTSFKIEGRTRSLYYLARVISAYRGARNDLVAGQALQPQHRDAAYMTEGRGFFPGFFKPGQGAAAQNYEETRVHSSLASVKAVIRSWDPASKRAEISVKGTIVNGDTLELMTPKGSSEIQVSGLKNHRRKTTDTLHSGMNNCSLDLAKDPGNFSFLAKRENATGN